MKEHLEFLDSLHVNLTQGGMLLVNFILAFVFSIVIVSWAGYDYPHGGFDELIAYIDSLNT